jgi:hypothetical protein
MYIKREEERGYMEKQKDRVMEGLLDYETELYQDFALSTETKYYIYWGALTLARKSKAITWETQLNMYGEFMSKILKLR